ERGCRFRVATRTLRISESASLRPRPIHQFQPGSRRSEVCVFGALLWALRAGYIPCVSAVDAGNGPARGLSGLSAAGRKSGVSSYRTVSEPVSPLRSALRICLATSIEDRSTWRIRAVLYEHERPELSKCGCLEWLGFAAVVGKCKLHSRSPEPATADVSQYPARQLSPVWRVPRHFPGFSAIQGAIHSAGEFAD